MVMIGLDGGKDISYMYDAGYWMLDVPCTMLDVGCTMLDVGCTMLDVECYISDIEYKNVMKLVCCHYALKRKF